jgi:hypothetical protein
MKNYRHFLLASFLWATVAMAEISPLPEFTLRLEVSPSDPLHGIGIFKSPFYLVVKDGKALLAQDEIPKEHAGTLSGTIDFVMRNGIDPSTKAPSSPILYLLFRHDGSGWSDDRFITEINIPFSITPYNREDRKKLPRPIGPIQFSEKATMTNLWQVGEQDKIRVITDPMGARFVQSLQCTTLRSDLRLPQ